MRHTVLHMEWSQLKSLLREIINNDEDGFHYMDFNVCLMLIQIIVWPGMAWKGGR